ncbi:tripartite tricarboxylate transporter TctB family protein [Pseudohalocynthiibacter aestuariivivens]|uniref:Tripartite tricarboxylate transporter TctB family protein n=1 Tax=Roseovarius pelagicus TaxID=2980108 RepID=A0ABY6DEM9_9RHOB|nr:MULTISPECIES: tripartite tricarboxylate transporter TctB family protein [Rhodobacterales]QIE46849.1 tripartite tricarboxylate transporter TctB family protein [Pseudohalocynthiibacter aestuariivivens]UXX84607.1 tripartite tricarboxylate transporter TctB family protein [Roseovarius pelagicus]
MTEEQTNTPPEVESGGREGLRDQVSACLLMAVVAVFWWDANAINAVEAQMYPRLVLGVLGALSVLLFIRGIRLGSQMATAPVITSWVAFLAFLIPTIIYAVAVGTIGFFTSSIFYIPLVAFLIGLRQHWLNALVTLIFLLATWLVFVALFARPLPQEIFWG